MSEQGGMSESLTFVEGVWRRLIGTGKEGLGLMAGPFPSWALNDGVSCAKVSVATLGCRCLERMTLRVKDPCKTMLISKASSEPSEAAYIHPDWWSLGHRTWGTCRDNTSQLGSKSHRSAGDSQVLQHFSEPEALHVIDCGRGLRVNVVDASERNSGRQVFVEAIHGGGSAVQIFGIASDSPSVEVGFEDLRTEDIVWASHVEAVLLVKRCLFGGRGTITSEVAIRRFEGEWFRANASPDEVRSAKEMIAYGDDILGALVCIPAGLGQLKAIINNELVVQ
jgi:hypothetical protein